MKRARVAGVAVLALGALAVAGPPALAGNGSICTGSTRPNVCLNQTAGFGGSVREYAVSTGGPAQSGEEAYRVEVLCGNANLTLRVIETARGLGLGLGTKTINTPVPAVTCPDLFPFLP